MSDYGELVERMENANNLVKESIKDLMFASKCMEELVKKLKNPILLIMSDDMGKEIRDIQNAQMMFFAMAANKMEVAGKYLENNVEKENKDGREEENDSI